VADEETFAVIGRVEEPAGDVVGAVAADLLRSGIVDVEAFDFYLELSVSCLLYLNVGFAEDHEEIARAGFLEEPFPHEQVGVHARREDGQLSVAAGFFGDMRVEGKATDEEQVEAESLDRFFGSFADQIGSCL